MHMADALVSPAVAGTVYVLSTGAAAYSVKKVREENDPEKQRRERDKQLRYLASKGFSYAAVRYVFDHFEELKEESCRTF